MSVSPPNASAPEPGGRRSGAEVLSEGRDLDRLRILLIEDDDGDARLAQDNLADWLPRAQVERCQTLAQAIASASRDLDCLILDLGLPDATGLEGVAKLRAHVPGVPLIVLTGLADESAGAAAVRAGAQDYLVKGQLDGGQLSRAIRYAIGRGQAERAARELLLAEAQAREVERLERGLTPEPFVEDAPVWVTSCSRPGRRRALLGGDFFDLIETDSGSVHALIGDVCGHGPVEAALGVSLRAAWRALTLSHVSPEAIVVTLQSILAQERPLPSLFATLCLMTIDPVAESAELIMAGHPRPALIDGESVRPLTDAAGCSAIGIGLSDWMSEHIELPSGWTILLYTDGIIEGRTGSGSRRLGEAGLHEALAAHVVSDPAWRDHPGELMDALVDHAEAANGEPLTDDVVMLLVGAGARSAASA